MGYEVKMFVVTHRDDSLGADGWCSVIGSVDLSKPGYYTMTLIGKYHEEVKKIPAKKRPFFYDNYSSREFKVRSDKYGDPLPLIPAIKVRSDKYGDPLPLIPAKEFLDALEEDNKDYQVENGDTYRRFDMAIGLLQSIFKSRGWQGELDRVYVMTWGY